MTTKVPAKVTTKVPAKVTAKVTTKVPANVTTKVPAKVTTKLSFDTFAFFAAPTNLTGHHCWPLSGHTPRAP